jgi:hypothetical protein
MHEWFFQKVLNQIKLKLHYKDLKCYNNQQTDEISMHLFPNKETGQQRRKKWVILSTSIDRVFTLPRSRVFVLHTLQIHAMMWILLWLILSIWKGDWEVYQSGLIEEVKDSGEDSQTWSGDGRFDSMGHSAKYGVYTMWSNTTSKLVHF